MINLNEYKIICPINQFQRNLYKTKQQINRNMGRIKTKLIKRKTKELMKVHGEKFTTDFTKNKELAVIHVQVESKKLRNIIAGYATRLKRQEK